MGADVFPTLINAIDLLENTHLQMGYQTDSSRFLF